MASIREQFHQAYLGLRYGGAQLNRQEQMASFRANAGSEGLHKLDELERWEARRAEMGVDTVVLSSNAQVEGPDWSFEKVTLGSKRH